MATVLHVKKYFGFEDMKEFSEEWKKLSDEEKKALTEDLQRLMDAGSWKSE